MVLCPVLWRSFTIFSSLWWDHIIPLYVTTFQSPSALIRGRVLMEQLGSSLLLGSRISLVPLNNEVECVPSVLIKPTVIHLSNWYNALQYNFVPNVPFQSVFSAPRASAEQNGSVPNIHGTRQRRLLITLSLFFGGGGASSFGLRNKLPFSSTSFWSQPSLYSRPPTSD